MRKITTLLLILLLAVTTVAVCACDDFNLNSQSDVEIVKDTKIIQVASAVDVVVGETTVLAPYLLDGSGRTVPSRFEYVSDNENVTVDSAGVLSAVGEVSGAVYVTVKEMNLKLEKRVLVRVHARITDVFGVSDESGVFVKPTDNLAFTYGVSRTFRAASTSGSVDISSYCTVTAKDESGAERNVFDVTFDNNAITLKPVGLGEGNLTVNLALGEDKSFALTVPFEIDLGNDDLQSAVMARQNSTLLAKAQMNALTDVYVNPQEVENLDLLDKFASVNTVVLVTDTVADFSYYDDSCEYRVKASVLNAYLADGDWSAVSTKIFPYAVSADEKYAVYHSEKATPFAYELVAAGYRIPVYQSAGYTNAEWLDGEGNHVGEVDLAASKNGLHVYASWTANDNTLSFHSNGGSGSMTAMTIKSDCSAVLTAVGFSRSGYTFLGWSADSTATAASYADKALYLMGKNSANDLYAVWRANVNKVVFHENAGKFSMVEQFIATDKQTELDIVPFERKGYTQQGWATSAEGTVKYALGGNYTMGTAEAYHLYAVWSANSNLLTFKANYPTTTPDIRKSCKTDEVVSPLESFERAGYTLDGWSETATGAAKYTTSYTMATTDTVLYAQWSANVNTLTFAANGGSGSMDDLKIATDASHLLTAVGFTRRGYDFKGWSTTQNGSVEYADKANYAMDAVATHTLYAVWELSNYTITYDDALAGTNPTSYFVTSETITISEPPEKAGYTFVNWFTDTARTTLGDTVEKGSIGNKTFYAKWQANRNTVVFNANGGDGTMSGQIIATAATAPLTTNAFTFTGYRFLGWSTTADGAVAYADGANYTMSTESEYNLYAQWELVVYTITYDLAQKGTNPDKYNVTSEKITLGNPPEETGYTFEGWYSDDARTNSCNTIEKGSTGNKVFYANWTPNDNTIYFNANGGSGSMDNFVIKTAQKKSLPLIAGKISRSGYAFLGWGESPTAEIAVALDGGEYTMGTTDVILYALWSVVTYRINYELNGGNNVAENPNEYSVASPNITLCDAQRTGYTFAGWFTDVSMGEGSGITAIATGSIGNKTLYAKWSANTYSINFNANGGSGSMNAQNGRTGETVTLTANAFTNSTKKFAGWSTQSSGASTYLNGGDMVMPANDVTLYAVWSSKQYTVSYNLNGGTNHASNVKEYDAGEAYALNAPTKTGYDFVSWHTSDTLTPATVATGISASDTGNKAFYAKWSPIKVKVKFDSNGSDSSFSDITVTYDVAYGTLHSPTRKHYNFGGWMCDGVRITSSTIMRKTVNHTLTASWTPVQYNVSASSTGVSYEIRVGGSKISSTVTYGSVITVTYSANSGYHSPNCRINGVEVSNGGSYKIISDTTVSFSAIDSCLSGDTLITMADGTTRQLREIRVGDMIMAFDHTVGALTPSKVAYVYSNTYCVDIMDLTFEDGLTLSVINTGHGLFDVDLNRYVLIEPSHSDDYIGHRFLYANVENGVSVIKEVKLLSVAHSTHTTAYYDVATENQINHVAGGLVGCSDVTVGVMNMLDFAQNYVFDQEALARDIALYGLYEYSDWSDYVTEEQFNAFNGSLFKIAVGKGLATVNDLIALINFVF